MLQSTTMKLDTFEMERMQSTWENQVRYNLTESGVHPLRVEDLVDDSIGRELLGYPQTNGTRALRELIASLYPGCGPDHVLVTNGAAEANFISTWNLLSPGDEMVFMVPNYMQIGGLARSLGAEVKPVWLQMSNGRWSLDLDSLERAVSGRTRLIALCNPNNPTGSTLTSEERESICEIGDRAGAWILADEIYQGAELDGKTTPSFWGSYERLVVTCGLSKAYGLPGLRIGWVVSAPGPIADLWRYKDYTTIGPGAISDFLARAALDPSRRTRILERTRRILNDQLPIVESWVRREGDLFTFISPRAGAMAYLQYHRELFSLDLFTRLKDEESVLIVPGQHFGMEHFLRIGFGGERAVLELGLSRISEVLKSSD
jgi:aspartate/methionine/tyrosine aminotransferase